MTFFWPSGSEVKQRFSEIQPCSVLDGFMIFSDRSRSHDGFTEGSDGITEALPGTNYATQRKVFNDLGQGVLDNAYEGRTEMTYFI